ncbi:hypothetical protein [Granulicella mallensis]|uniref:PNPLA domain-containing protein n=1 Tax=Granulicella mallensis TaxID=940614 RepID=A0A7W8EAP5_9BACT|nr:hypothetical protein [Granulicella mallensis]MBB5065012.1 hypothetical protein [Granulicella mallensis]
MAAINSTGLKSLSSGLMVAETIPQYVCIGFFLICTGFVALIGMRVIAINGAERFNDDGPPSWIISLLRNNRGRNEHWAIVLATFPSLFGFIYLFNFGTSESVDGRQICLGLAIGTVLAFIFWWPLNLLYYILYIYDAAANTSRGKVILGKNAARTILMPRSWFLLPSPSSDVDLDTVETAGSAVPKILRREARLAVGFRSFVTRLQLPGYVQPGGNNLYEGTFFSVLAAIGFFFIYLALWPMTAPVPTRWAWAGVALIFLMGGTVIALLLQSGATDATSKFVLRGAAIVIGLYTLVFPLLYVITDAERFPALASITIAVLVFFWLLDGLAFFLDRYRVPVTTLFVVFVILPRNVERWLHVEQGREEHYLSVSLTSKKTLQKTPAEILDDWYGPEGDLDQPLIIVTATGGGLHASAWTASVLAQLEWHVSKQWPGQHLYEHMLLASTVSGGSTGFMSYVDQLRRSRRDFSSIPISASCSSLEAISWGLIYHDLPVAAFFPIPLATASATGVDDLLSSPMGKDRTWALRRGFSRNLTDDYCVSTWNDKAVDWSHPVSKWITLDFITRDADNEKNENKALNLSGMGFTRQLFPAFTMNTTTAEYGDRFLLANYQLPRYAIGEKEALPAESFLQVYGDTDLGSEDDPRYPDLPLPTAAQLSATFPYVSSAARFPDVYGRNATHFIDGGYYDNDGTASVLEFLRYALDDPEQGSGKTEDKGNYAALAALKKRWQGTPGLPGKRVRVVLIEIRNDAYDPAESVKTFRSFQPVPQSQTGTGDLLTQLTAPLQGLWEAGHESVTSRNRASLEVLRQAYGNRLQLHHVVIADERSNSTGTDPLNWSLTPRQRNEIKRSASDGESGPNYEDVLKWLDGRQPGTWDSVAQTATETNANEQPMVPNISPETVAKSPAKKSSTPPMTPTPH